MVLLHGVAFGPRTFATVAAGLARRGMCVVVPHRPGYGRSAATPVPSALAAQVRMIVRTLAATATEPVILAGVSGGATLALACTLEAPELVRHLVLHEPAIGPLAPTLADTLRRAADDFATAHDPRDPARSLAQTLAGPRHWERHASHLDLTAIAPTMAREVPLFATFAPTPAALRELRSSDVTTTRGADSGPARKEVSAALVDLCGAREIVLAGGHLVQLESPDAFAGAIVAVAEAHA